MIEARSITKHYGQRTAVDGVSLHIHRGESFGLLGPNGAGKTTTILMLTGALRPDGGQIEIGGMGSPARADVRREIGIAPQALALYEELTGEENLLFFGRMQGLGGPSLRQQVAWALDFAGLTDRRSDRAGRYSGGMLRRLNLACAVVHRPRILFCDEPTVGVDPQSRRHIFESIGALKDEGLTLIYTTHYMEEAQDLCDRVAIMDQGRILALDTVEGLIDKHGGSSQVKVEFSEPPPEDLELPGECEGGLLTITTDRPFDTLGQLGRAPVEIVRLRVDRPDLERVFLHLTGRRLRD